MKKTVIVTSRHNFERLVKSLSVRQRSEAALISIRDREFPEIYPTSPDVLNLTFDDAETDEGFPPNIVELFSDEHAKQIVDFTLNNSHKKLFIVHCLMGVSRSGAVGDVLADHFKIPYAEFKRLNQQIIPNSLVRTKLREAFSTIWNNENF